MKLHLENEWGYSRCTITVLIAWLLSLTSVLYTRLVSEDIFPWKSTVLPWHIEDIFQAMFCMILGYMFRQQWEKTVDKYNIAKMRVTVIAVYLLRAFMPILTDVKVPMIIDILYGYITTVIGIVALGLITKMAKSNWYVNFIGQNILIYFALHGKVYSVIETILKQIASSTYTVMLNYIATSSVFCLILSLILSVVL